MRVGDEEVFFLFPGWGFMALNGLDLRFFTTIVLQYCHLSTIINALYLNMFASTSRISAIY